MYDAARTAAVSSSFSPTGYSNIKDFINFLEDKTLVPLNKDGRSMTGDTRGEMKKNWRVARSTGIWGSCASGFGYTI
jgi:hypothetical protein